MLQLFDLSKKHTETILTKRKMELLGFDYPNPRFMDRPARKHGRETTHERSTKTMSGMLPATPNRPRPSGRHGKSEANCQRDGWGTPGRNHTPARENTEFVNRDGAPTMYTPKPSEVTFTSLGVACCMTFRSKVAE